MMVWPDRSAENIIMAISWNYMDKTFANVAFVPFLWEGSPNLSPEIG